MNPSAVGAELSTRQIIGKKGDWRVGGWGGGVRKGGSVGLKWTQKERPGSVGHTHLCKVTGMIEPLTHPLAVTSTHQMIDE